MLKSLRIENFRCFKEYELQQLGRVNLLVGMNNHGKTAILEAIYLLYSQDDLSRLAEIMINRGEFIWRDEGDKREQELDIRHLFYGHQVEINSQIGIWSEESRWGIIVKIVSLSSILDVLERQEIILQQELADLNDNQNIKTRNMDDIEKNVQEMLNKKSEIENLRKQEQEIISNFFLRKLSIYIHYPKGQSFIIPLLDEYHLLLSDLRKRQSENINSPDSHLFFLTSPSLTTEKMIDLFEQIVLTPDEELVIEALQIIEPTVKRIAIFRDNFVVLLSDNDQRIPIGNMGDGIQRILGLTLALVNAKDGILLVDEIDTGLHFMAMSKMWKLVWETANKLNVQVFATTHNSDCWTSLTELIDPENSREDGIFLHRIEKDKPHSILLTERQIAIAAEHDIEVR
jgi:hypothetical protein